MANIKVIKSNKTDIEDEKAVSKDSYRPGKEELQVITDVYKAVEDLIEVRDTTYKEFNDRVLTHFVDDGDHRLNTFVIDKDSYDPPKEDWQSNVVLPTIRDKQMKILAGFALSVPEVEVKAYGEDKLLDTDRGEMAKWLIQGSYLEEENSIVENFWESWECASRGTVIKYEGYLKVKAKQKYIKSYDISTGAVEVAEREVDVDDKCISFIVPITEFYPRDFYVHDVQEQDDCAWIRYYSKERATYEFGRYPNWTHVKTKLEMSTASTESEYHKSKWSTRVEGEEDIEIVRYYNILTDSYIIIANGVLLLDAPLLWKVNGKKQYPFAKTIWSPFVTKHFFYGNSFPNLMMGQYDNYNTLWNTLHDKEFRSLVPAILVGMLNRDSFDLEDEWLTGTTKISVADVNQVKVMEQAGVNNADVMMLKLVAQNLEDSAPSLPSLLGNKKATAREIVIADEKLQEMKTLHSELIVDLWRQKYALRLANIQLNYPQPRTIIDPETGKEKTINRTYIIENAELDSVTGERGVLAVQFKKVSKKALKKTEEDLAVEEKMMSMQGINYKKVLIPPNYFDNHMFRMAMIPDSITRVSQARAQASVLEKLASVSQFFPQIFLLNQKEYFEEFAKAYGDNPSKQIQKFEQFQDKAKAQRAQGKGEEGGEGEGQPAQEAPPTGQTGQ